MAYMNTTATEFAQEYGGELLENLFYALYEYMDHESQRSSERCRTGTSTPKKSNYPNIYFHSFVRHNATNVEAWGYFDDPKNPEGEQIEFRIQDGDNNGSDLIEYGPELKEPTRTVRKTIPKMVSRESFSSDAAWEAYQLRFNANLPRLEELGRNFDYDRYFAPGGKTNQYYNQIAKEFPLNWEVEYETVPVNS